MAKSAANKNTDKNGSKPEPESPVRKHAQQSVSTNTSTAGSQAGMVMARAFMLCESQLKRFIGRFLYRPEDIDELAQETFLRAYVASETTEVRSPEAYLYRVAKNIALKELDRKSNRMTDFLEEALSEDTLEGHPAADEELIAEQKLASYCDALASLPPQCRKVFLLRKVQAKSYREIADILNISVSAVEKQVSKGLERFDDFMAMQDEDYLRQSRASHSISSPTTNSHSINSDPINTDRSAISDTPHKEVT